MNGRVFDPFTARFMSGDPFVQDPVNGQSYNRYSYVLNNPTNLTDPTGFASCGQKDGDPPCATDEKKKSGAEKINAECGQSCTKDGYKLVSDGKGGYAVYKDGDSGTQ